MNYYSGATVFTHGGVCVGEATACVGVEQGESMYFDCSGGFCGVTIYTEVYAQYGGHHFAAMLADEIGPTFFTVIAPTTYVDIDRNNITGNTSILLRVKNPETGEFNITEGTWMKCLNGKGCEPYLDAYGEKMLNKNLLR